MNPGRRFRAGEKRLQEVLFAADTFQHIPDYQRSFTWTNKNLEDFWEGLVGPDAAPGAFAGSFLLLEVSDDARASREIVDGQQRATVTNLLLAALRDISEKIGSTSDPKTKKNCDIWANELQNHLTPRAKNVWEESDPQPRLLASQDDREFFRRYLFGPPEFEPTKLEGSQKKIHDAYRFFCKKIEEALNEDIETQKPQLQTLDSIYKKLLGLWVVEIIIEDESVKFEIFESVNAKGFHLAPKDLIKNHLISKGKTEAAAKDIFERWRNLEKRAKLLKGQGQGIQEILKIYWSQNHNYVLDKDLFHAIKSFCMSQKEVDEILSGAERLCESLITLADGNLFTSNDSSVYLKYFAFSNKILNILDKKIHRNLFSLLYEKRDLIQEKHTATLSDLAARFIISFLGICHGATSRNDRALAKIARALNSACQEQDEARRRTKVDKAIEEGKKELKSRWPGRENMRESLQELRYENQTKGLLRVLFALLEIPPGAPLERSIDWDSINIEHIQPRNPADGEEKSYYANWVDTLGNLTLISSQINKSMGNKNPKAKVPDLKSSSLKISQEVARIIETNGWTPKEIEQRQHDLINELLRTLDPETTLKKRV